MLHHVSHSGDEVWSVRAGTQRQMDLYTIRKLCDIADTFAEGHVRFTIRSNIEFMVSDPNKVAPLIEALTSNGFPVGGTGNSVSMIAHTQGWLHSDIPGTDASGAVKALMDELHEEFIREEMPNRVHLSTSCCEINCGGQADIAIIVQHTKPPEDQPRPGGQRVRAPGGGGALPGGGHPAGAGERQTFARSGREEVHLLRRLLPAVPANADQRPRTLQARHLGGRQEQQCRGKPTFMKMVASGLPNNPPRWPEVSELVKRILHVYKNDARSWERMATGSSASAAALLREVRPALHQVPDRRLARLARQPERLHPHPLLAARP